MGATSSSSGTSSYGDLLFNLHRRDLERVARISQAKGACYWRLHPKPWIDSSSGARKLYDAVCELWREAHRPLEVIR